MPIVHSFFTDLRRVAENPTSNRNRNLDLAGDFIDKDVSNNLVLISAILIHAYLIDWTYPFEPHAISNIRSDRAN